MPSTEYLMTFLLKPSNTAFPYPTIFFHISRFCLLTLCLWLEGMATLRSLQWASNIRFEPGDPWRSLVTVHGAILQYSIYFDWLLQIRASRHQPRNGAKCEENQGATKKYKEGQNLQTPPFLSFSFSLPLPLLVDIL